jgi:hypothetical protein
MRNFLLATLLILLATPIIANAQSGFGADVGFSKMWVDNKTLGDTLPIDGAMPALTFRHVMEWIEKEDGTKIAKDGLQFGYASLASGDNVGEANRIFGRYFTHFRGLYACGGAEGIFLEAGTLATETTNCVGLNAALQFPSMVADQLPFEISGAYSWGIRGDEANISSVFLGFTGQL